MFADEGPWFADPVVAKATGFVHMGVAADLLATRSGFGRADLDAVAVESHARAHRAREGGYFAGSLVPVCGRDGEVVLDHEENIRPTTSVESLARFEPAFAVPGEVGGDALALGRYPELGSIEHVHHVGVSPALADGSSALLVTSGEGAERIGRKPRARVLSFATFSVEPVLMLTGNVEGTRRALEAAGVALDDVDVFEVNESFAAVPLHFQRTLGVDPERLNPNGGAIAMGHPLGATGGVLVAAALDDLERRDGQLAVVSICGGAGVTVSAVIERV
jgi:acetyl-CoA C-acetyltransferase